MVTRLLSPVKQLVILGLTLAALSPGLASAALTPADHPLFDGDAVHEIHLTFHQTGWWNLLVDNFENYEDIPYLAAEFDWGATHLDSIGVRFKGNSSYFSYSGYKKSFKLDIDEYVSGQEISGLDKLNLNNCFLDPTLVREKCAYEMCEAVGLPTVRTNYADVYINGDYWGLYLLVEQFDQEFIESRFGAEEEGNLWKGDPSGTLEYFGTNESSYYSYYELETNETANDWSALVDLVDRINNTPLAALPDSLHEALDVSSALAMLAVDLFTVNLDSYPGRGPNYYMYHRDLDGRFVFAKWDCNEAWGVFNMYGFSTTQLQQLSPFWTNPSGNRPLAEQLWQISGFEDVYLGHMQKLMASVADPDVLVNRMEDLRDLIRTSVYAEPNNMFSTADFENAMTSTIYASGGPPPGRAIPALETFIRNRDSYLQGLIGSWTPVVGLVLNEVMAVNNNTITDEHGDYDDWIEVANVSGATIDLSGLGLTDHLEGTPDYLFPSTTLAPGEYLIVWADEEPGEGDLHAPFKLDGDGEDVYLTDGAVIVDQVTYPALAGDVSWGRWPDGSGDWQLLNAATPGAENENPEIPEVVVLYINEFLAVNDSGIQDASGAFEDWLELYNPGPDAVELGGLFLTDDLLNTTQWSLPDTTLAAGDFLVIWCDNDPEEGVLHASFKLSGSGEEIGLFGRLAAGNEVIDSYVFGAQTADVSEGREDDGDPVWTTFATPTPGDSNGNGTPVPEALVTSLQLLPNVPNPFNPTTALSFTLPTEARVRLEIFDVRGWRVVRLLDTMLPAGVHTENWNGMDGAGRAMGSGVYFARLTGNGQTDIERMMLVR